MNKIIQSSFLLVGIGLLASTNSFADKLDKVEVCHFSDTQVQLKSVSENALGDHLAHGDVLASQVDDCELPPASFCLKAHYEAGIEFPEETGYALVDYYPSSGEVMGTWQFGDTLSGTVFPIGLPENSIYSVGATFSFDSSPWDTGRAWIGSGLAYDTSGSFIGFWAPAEGDAGAAYLDREPVPSDYTFLPVSSCFF